VADAAGLRGGDRLGEDGELAEEQQVRDNLDGDARTGGPAAELTRGDRVDERRQPVEQLRLATEQDGRLASSDRRWSAEDRRVDETPVDSSRDGTRRVG